MAYYNFYDPSSFLTTPLESDQPLKTDPPDLDRSSIAPIVDQASLTGSVDFQPQVASQAPVKFVTPQDIEAVQIGHSRDPYQLDTDPTGEQTVKWGKMHGVGYDLDYVKSANIFGKTFSREQLEATGDGRRLLRLMESRRAGNRRDFFSAMADWSVADAPFLSLFATVGNSTESAVLAHDAFQKWSAGEPLTDDEAIAARLYLAEQEQRDPKNQTWGATVGDIVRAAPGFMIEFAATGGLFAKARTAVAASAAKSGARSAATLLPRMTKLFAKDAVERGFAAELGATAEKVTEATLRTGWKSLSTDAGRATVQAVKSRAVRELTPHVKSALKSIMGFTEEAADAVAGKIAAARVDTEIGRAIALNSSDHAVVRWTRGLVQSARDHVSRALLDFGDFGSEAYSATSKELGSAMSTLGQAVGILGVEAPLRGALVEMPQAFAVKPLLLATGVVGKDGRSVSEAQLSLEATAARTGNKALMSSAEAVASAMNFLEYASEQSGPGFGKLLRSAGLGLFGAKAMGVAGKGTAGLFPAELVEASASRLRQWINMTVGTSDQFFKGHARKQAGAVAHMLEKAELPSVSDDVLETFVRSRNVSELAEAVARAGGDVRKTPGLMAAVTTLVGDDPVAFIRRSVKEAVDDQVMDKCYRSWFRYAMCDFMSRHRLGPDEMSRWMKTAGYDGIVEEMLEERYSDFVKGLFGFDDKSTEFHGFGPLVMGLEKGSVVTNLKKAFSNLNPGWEQLTAEAVGFAVPMGVRVAVHNIQRAAGGGDLSFLQNFGGTMREFRGVNNVVEAETGTHLRVAREEIQAMKDQLLHEAEDGTRTGLQAELERIDAELEAQGATTEYREARTSALREKIADITQRISAAEQRAAQLESVSKSAEYNASRISAYEALDTTERADTAEFRRRGTATEAQARRGIVAQNVMVQGAAEAGRILAKSRDAAADYKHMPLWRRAVARAVGFVGAVATGDISLAQYDPMAWAAEDNGLSGGVVGVLADAYDMHRKAAMDRLHQRYADEVASGSTDRTVVEPTEDEIQREMEGGYEAEAKAIMSSYLTALGVRMFSRREMTDQARSIVENKYGGIRGHEAEVDEYREKIAYATLKLLSGGAVQSTNMRRASRGIINLTDDCPFADEVVLDAALQLSGFRGLEETLELRPETDLKDSVHGRSLSAKLVKNIASIDLARPISDDQQASLIAAAKALGFSPRYTSSGSSTMLYTPEAIGVMNRKVVGLCKKALAIANPRLRTFRRISGVEGDVAVLDGQRAPEYVQVRQTGNVFTWTDNDNVSRSVEGEDALLADMHDHGFEQTDTNIVFALAREIRTRDPAIMLDKLGLSGRYYAMATRGGTQDVLASKRIHPLFRVKNLETMEKYTVEEAQKLLQEELAAADKYRSVMNRAIPVEDKIAAFRQTSAESEADVAKRYADAEQTYKYVYGSEQREEGYIPTIEKLLSAHGVQLRGSRMSYSALLASDQGWYTLNTRNLNFADGMSYVFVDLARDIDYDGPLMTKAITNGLMANRKIWAYDGESEKYPPFAGVVRDLVKRLDRVAYELARDSLASNREGEADAMMELKDMLTGGTNLESPRLNTVAWLVRNVVLGQATKEAAKSKSTTHLVAASARLAEALQQTQEFYPFLGFADLILGGDGFALAADRAKDAPLTGVARLAAVFSDDPETYHAADLVTKSMLPVQSDGTRMSVDDFLSLVNNVVSGVGKAQNVQNRRSATFDQAQVREAYDRGPMSFVAEIMSQAGLKTASELRDFMGAVLKAAGIRAGYTEDLANWSRAVADTQMERARHQLALSRLTSELAETKAELEKLQKELAEGTNARVAELQARNDELVEEINRLKETLAAGSSPSVSDDPSGDAPVTQEPDPPQPFKAPDPDLTQMGQDTLDQFNDSLGADDLDIGASFDMPEPEEKDEGLIDPDVPVLSPEARHHVHRTVVRALAAQGGALNRDSVERMAKTLFPAMSPADRAEIFDHLDQLAQQADASRADEEAALLAVRDYVDEQAKAEHTSDSEGWDDKAKAAYDSLKPFLEMMETAAPLSKRNFQGLLNVLRGEVARLEQELPQDNSELSKTIFMLNRLLNPKTVSTGVAGEDGLTQRLAAHRARVAYVFGSNDKSRTALDTMIRELVSYRRPGDVRPVGAQLAAFLSFLGGVSNEGTRQSLMLLASSSIDCDTVATEAVEKLDDNAGDGSTYTSSDLAVRSSSTSRGQVSVSAISTAFLSLVGLSRDALVERLDAYRATMADIARTRMRPVMFDDVNEFIDSVFENSEISDEDDPTDSSISVVYTGRRRTVMLTQELANFRENAHAVADALGQIFGQDNPLSQMLRSSMLYREMHRVIMNGSVSSVKSLLYIFKKFAVSKSRDELPASQVISSILDELTKESSVTQDRVVNVAQAAFSTGKLTNASLRYPVSTSSITDEWMTLMNTFTQAMPATVARTRAVKGRTTRRSQIAVAAPGAIPILLRYIQQTDDTSPLSFRRIAMRLVRRDAESAFWSEEALRTGGYVNPANFTDRADVQARLKAYVDARIEAVGGIEGIVAKSLQTLAWPDAARTPIIARNLTVDYSPVEAAAACAYAYEGSMDGKTKLADNRGMWFVPLFGGDHAANNLIQVPTGCIETAGGRVLSYKEAATALNKAMGVDLMMSDTKRSAITSATAAATPMIGADIEFNGLDEIVKGFGECRLHVSLNFGEEDDHEFSQEAMHGETVACGIGPNALRAMSKDAGLRVAKFHAIGTGDALTFEKSATSIVDERSLEDGGMYPPGSMSRAYADHILGFALDGETAEHRRRTSSDTITDEDSYKVGPLKSKVIQIALETGAEGKVTRATTILDYIKTRLKAGDAPAVIMATPVRVVDRSKGPKPGELVPLSGVLPGLRIDMMRGLNPGTAKGDRAFSVSYQDNSMLALRVANIAHGSKPHLGRNSKNYTIDACTKAVEQMFEAGTQFGSADATAQSNVFNALVNYAILAGAVASDPESVRAALEEDPRLSDLMNNGADPGGIDYRRLFAETSAKRLRESMLASVNKVDAVLVSCGATLAKDGTVLDHSLSQMRRDIHHGSIVLDSAETGAGGLYEGFQRRLALAEVNVTSPSFRYGMFLDVDRLASVYGEVSLKEGEKVRRVRIDPADDRTVMQAVETAVIEIVNADRAYEVARVDAARNKGNEAKMAAAREAQSLRRELRRTFMSCFIDHHGEDMSKASFKAKDRKGTDLTLMKYDLVSFDDLLVGHKDTYRFDRTALHLGEDRVTHEVHDWRTGQLDKTASKGKMAFLAGTAFLAPRTPSYNGGMWLQVVRASLPVTEQFVHERFIPGRDGLVALDPQTLDILGCDNDGDESALSIISAELSGVVRTGDLADSVVTGLDESGFEENGLVSSALDTEQNRIGMLERASAVQADFTTYVAKRKDGRGYEFTAAGRRAMSNQLLLNLVSMAHQLPVPQGSGRRGFASPESGRTKAQPFDDARWWKREAGEEPGMEGVDRLVDLMPPDLIEDGQTIGDPDLQAKVGLSAKLSDRARGTIVQAASALHIAFMSGCFTEREVNARVVYNGRTRHVKRTNRYTLFSEDLLRSPEKWRAFIRHFDGLSNATFDDIKERICQRLGLTPGMIDTLVCDLLSERTVPTTDKEWYDALARYVVSVRDRLPDGTPVWKAGMASEIGADDKSRFFMSMVSNPYESTWHGFVDDVLFSKQFGRDRRRVALMTFLGLERDTSGKLFTKEPETTGKGLLARRFLSLPSHLANSVLSAAVEAGGHNDVTGYILWMAGSCYGSLHAAKTNAATDLAKFRERLAGAWSGFGTYIQRRQAWKKAKDFARALNFSQSDPGAPNAARRKSDAEQAYIDVMRENFDTLDTRNRHICLSMRQAARMAYSSGLVDSATPEGRVHAARRRVDDLDGSMNSDLIDVFSGRGDRDLADGLNAVSLAVANAASANRVVSDADLDGARDNMTSLPYVVASIQTMPHVGMVSSDDDAEALVRAVARGAAHDGRETALYFKDGVESLFSCMYALMATSTEGVEHPGFSYFGQRSDRAFSLPNSPKSAGQRAVRDYGIGKESLSTIFPTFAVRDEAALRRARAAVAEIQNGWFDGRERHLRYTPEVADDQAELTTMFMARIAGALLDRAASGRVSAKRLSDVTARIRKIVRRYSGVDVPLPSLGKKDVETAFNAMARALDSTRDAKGAMSQQNKMAQQEIRAAVNDALREVTRSFDLTTTTLDGMLSELGAYRPQDLYGFDIGDGSTRRKSKLQKDIEAAKRILAAIADVLHKDVAAVKLRPSDIMNQLMPVYVTMTQPVTGTPTYEQFTNSSLSLLKGLYRRLSRSQASNDRAFARVSDIFASHATTNVNPNDMLSVLDFAPPSVTDTRRSFAEAAKREGRNLGDMVKEAFADETGCAVSRRNPEGRHVVDIFGYGGVLFKAARLYKSLSAMAASRSDKAADDALVDQTDVMETPASEATETSPRVRTLADNLTRVLGAFDGLNVEVEGNTITVTGRIVGEAALKRRGVKDGYVNAVVRIDVSKNGRVSNLDLESESSAVSITHALRTAGYIDMSAHDFLNVLTHDERLALVRRFMPHALGGQSGVALKAPIWSIDGKGILTLASAVTLKSADEKLAYHEYFHAMMGMLRSLGMISSKDAEHLSKQFGPARSSAEQFDEEAAADAFAQYVSTKRKSAPRSAVAKFFAKILKFVQSVLKAMTNHGFSYGESIKVGDQWVTGAEQLYNVVLSGRAVESVDTPKAVKLDLKAARQVAEASGEAAAQRVTELLGPRVAAPRALSPEEILIHRQLMRLLEGDGRFNAEYADNLIDAAAAAAGIDRVRDEARADVAGGEAEDTIARLSDEVANSYADLLSPGDGVHGDTPATMRRLTRLGNGITHAIAAGIDAIDPSVFEVLDGYSDLGKISATAQVQQVVFDGVFDAAEALGVDLKTQEKHLKNLVYGSCLSLYDDISTSVQTYRGSRTRIMHRRRHRGEYSETKAFLTRSDIAAYLLTAGGLDYADMARDSLGRLAEMRALPDASPAFVRIIDHLTLNLRRLVDKTTFKGDPIYEIKAGIKQAPRNRETGKPGLFTENKRADSRTALRNRNMYQLASEDMKEFEPLVQEALDLSLRTAFTLSAAKKFYAMMDIVPTNLRGDEIPGGLGRRVRPRNRRSVSPVDTVDPSSSTGLHAATAYTPSGPVKVVEFDGFTVNFSDVDHRYWTDQPDGQQFVFTSGTGFIGSFFPKFNAEEQARKMRTNDADVKELLEKWKSIGDKSAARGTLIHKVYEDILTKGTTDIVAPEGDEKLATMIKGAEERAREILRDYDVLGVELTVASKALGIAGTIDVLARNKKTGRLTIIDHKTSKWIGRRGFYHKDTGAEDQMLHGVGLPASRLNSYALQVQLYARLLAENPPKGVDLAKDEPIDFVINLYNGLSENELAEERSRAERVYSENPDIVVRSAWLHDELPDLSGALDKMLDYAKEHPEEVLPPSGVNRGLQPPAKDIEVAEALQLSMEDLLSDRKFIDPFCEVGLYVNNPGEWLASTCRSTFGGRPLRQLFAEEHSRLKGDMDTFIRKVNWWARVLGEDKLEGQPLLAVIHDKGHHVVTDGRVVYDETGHDRIGFDNYSIRALGTGRIRGNVTNVTLDRSDKELIDFWLKSIYFEGMGGSKVITGVDGLTFSFSDLEPEEGREWTAADFTRDKVLAKYNESHVGREIPRIYIALAEMITNQIPSSVLDAGFYDTFVNAVVTALNDTKREIIASEMRGDDQAIPPSHAGQLVLRRLSAAGVVVNHVNDKGIPARAAVCVPVESVETTFRKSAAYKKLLDAGRYETDSKGNAVRDANGELVPLFSRDRILKDCMDAYRSALRTAESSPWMVSGDGRHFNNFSTAMPFFAGPGAFMYWARRIGRDEKKDVAARMNQYEASLIETLTADDQPVTDAQLNFLHDLFDTGSDTGAQLRSAVSGGEYEPGSAKSLRTGLELSPGELHTHAVAKKIYCKLCEIAWADKGSEATVRKLGGRGSVARMIDMYEQAAGKRTAIGGVGLNAEQMYQINGVLPANFQCFHAVTTAMESLARTCQFRNTFVDFLFATDAQGRPVSYAKPSLTNQGYVDDGIPEEVWEYLARWWAGLHGKEYDENKSGRVNAARLYDEIVTANESKTINGRHFRLLDGSYRENLSSVSDFAAVDDDTTDDSVSVRNRLNGGETFGYAKMLFSIPRVVGGKAQSMLMHRVSSYSKTLSVQFSAFFPIATKIESPAGAVGFWSMIMSNFAPGTARKLDKLMKKFDKAFHTNFGDVLNRDFIGFKDIIEMMDTDDPFLADAVRICDAMGITLTDRLANPYESDKAVVQQDKDKAVALLRNVAGESVARHANAILEGLMFRGSERAFSYALNATKIATALQIAQKCQARCAREGRAFDIVNEVKPYAAYINAEIGGIDPMRYAWANPDFRRLMNMTMFSWEWSKGAWAAGGGEVLEDIFLGGHYTNPETRQQLVGRWMRMFGAIMIGVPMLMQALCKLIGLALGWDDDDDKWGTWQNESKIGMSAFDITPLLKGLTRGDNIIGRPISRAVKTLKSLPVLGRLVPGYTGKDPFNTTGGRRYYMHFGKQGWEFLRWFQSPEKQALSKLSMHLQRVIEGVLGYNPASREYDLPFTKKSQAERWLFPTLDSATFNLLRSFAPFSFNAMSTYGDAGGLSILGPVKMGTSYMAAVKDASERLTTWANNDRGGYSHGYKAKKSKFRALSPVSDIVHGARLNGMDPWTILYEATGMAAKPLYNQLYDALPLEAGDSVDRRTLSRIVRGLHKLNVTRKQAISSLEKKLKIHGKDLKTMDAKTRLELMERLHSAFQDPFDTQETDNAQPQTMRRYDY